MEHVINITANTPLHEARTATVVICLAAMASLHTAPLANQLDDDLQTVWEALWDQRGTPRTLMRWDNKGAPIRYRMFGVRLNRQREHIQRAIQAVADASGLQFHDVSDLDTAEQNAQLDIEVVRADQLQDREPCLMRILQRTNFHLSKVQIQMRESDVERCAHHEMMHAMGVIGHPRGRTVLSYFATRGDRLLPIDKTMLKAIYSAQMPNGATLFEALPVLAKYVTLQAGLQIDPSQASQRATDFLNATVKHMQAFAQGAGEVPVIIKLSGKASATHMSSARNEVAHYLGLAHLRGVIVSKDYAVAAKWFAVGAAGNFAPSQMALARVYYSGLGIEKNQTLAMQWFRTAAANGNDRAHAEIEKIERAQAENGAAPPIETPQATELILP